MNWEFLNIREMEEQMGQSFITIPFENDFGLLNPEEKAAFNEAIQERVKTYAGFTSILKELLGSFK